MNRPAFVRGVAVVGVAVLVAALLVAAVATGIAVESWGFFEEEEEKEIRKQEKR
jgi:hypothetical protein